MRHINPGTLHQRLQSGSLMISACDYDTGDQLSRNLEVGRQTRYNPARLGGQTMAQIFHSPSPTSRPGQLKRYVLTLLVAVQVGYPGIPTSLRCFGSERSLGNFAATIKRAAHRAQTCLNSPAPTAVLSSLSYSVSNAAAPI